MVKGTRKTGKGAKIDGEVADCLATMMVATRSSVNKNSNSAKLGTRRRHASSEGSEKTAKSKKTHVIVSKKPHKTHGAAAMSSEGDKEFGHSSQSEPFIREE